MRGDAAGYGANMRTPAGLLVSTLLLACGADPSATAAGGSSGATMVTTGAGAGTGVSSGEPGTGTATPTGEAPTVTGEVGTGTSVGETTSDASSGGDTTTGTPREPDPWAVRRGIMHLHSPYSHDACDGEGLMNGVPNAPCLADLRAALCDTGLDFAFLTDHPVHMQEYPFDRVLLYSQGDGDELVMARDMALSNRMHCADDRRVLLGAGYEATHTLPLGLHHHVDAKLYASLSDDVPIDEAKALVAGLQAGGAVVAMAHSEEDDLSAARIVEVGLEAMEWYNPHGNFKTVLGGDSITADPAGLLELLQGLLPFMAGSKSGAHPDLVYLRLLPSWPVEGFNKWREVQRSRAVTGILGSDVHQNVAVAPLCLQDNPVLQAACVAAAEAILPDALAGLVTGGTIDMADGDRLDSYARIMRWLENRVLTPPGPLTLAMLQDALRAGHNYGLFSVFGEPEGLRFVGHAGEDVLWIGDAASGPVTLELRAPVRPVAFAGEGPQWTGAEGDKAELRSELWRSDANGTMKVDEVVGLGGKLEHVASEPGAYHVEVHVRPQHLRAALGTEEALADGEYLWLITNPIRVQ